MIKSFVLIQLLFASSFGLANAEQTLRFTVERKHVNNLKNGNYLLEFDTAKGKIKSRIESFSLNTCEDSSALFVEGSSLKLWLYTPPMNLSFFIRADGVSYFVVFEQIAETMVGSVRNMSTGTLHPGKMSFVDSATALEFNPVRLAMNYIPQIKDDESSTILVRDPSYNNLDGALFTHPEVNFKGYCYSYYGNVRFSTSSHPYFDVQVQDQLGNVYLIEQNAIAHEMSGNVGLILKNAASSAEFHLD